MAFREPIDGAGPAIRQAAQACTGNETGSQLLEFALVLPILVSLMLGIITGGLALNANVSMNNAARESARFAATLPVDPSMTDYLHDTAGVAIRSATGDLDDGVAGRQVCVAYVYPDGVDPDDQTTRLIIDPAGVPTTTVGARCFEDGRPDDERRVQVSLHRDADLIVVFFSRTLNLEASSVARYERMP